MEERTTRTHHTRRCATERDTALNNVINKTLCLEPFRFIIVTVFVLRGLLVESK